MLAKQKTIYIIGALKNWDVVTLANELEALGFEAFADWITPGPEADAYLLKYAKLRGWSYKRALASHAARHVFEFDKFHIDRSDIVIMLMPAGRSGHLELGYARGCGKPGYILFDKEPERLDIMYLFATDVFFNKADLIETLKTQL
jgi:nucleoside 2-deoxyribosyltransferase